MPLSDILCCWRSKGHSRENQRDVINERSHLIPTTNDQPEPIPSIVPIDPARVRERLGVIVRAKEERMVNVIPSYQNRDLYTNPNHRSRVSSIRTDSLSASHSAQDFDSITGTASPAQTQTEQEAPVNDTEGDSAEIGNGEEDVPKIVISTPRKPIQRPAIPVFDDPNVKLSISWGD
ncbi:hypothetical protein BDP27DRAFT_1373253 [Rhodocollybia butyracea]|uniref:Uncharacterized protein n=1 Tax=Rhodocollybia butyracea TaxID=206335 RepID=A0A9P5TY70_9AGAR|nr:hypothetical protein BDP27DRAFT_1373253 [Rhodocollybia butyracea]